MPKVLDTFHRDTIASETLFYIYMYTVEDQKLEYQKKIKVLEYGFMLINF